LELANCALLATAAGRHAQGTRVDEAITAWTSLRTPAEVELELQRRGVPAHVSASSRDLAEDPQLRHRGHFVTLDHPTLQTVTVEGPRYLLSETPGAVRRPAPTFGRDNLHVLRELLGYPPERIVELEAGGALR
jgi:crotonobetainyl-CoA:carnitine CoA-transferase CaiB-like acyl-CoA transferase